MLLLWDLMLKNFQELEGDSEAHQNEHEDRQIEVITRKLGNRGPEADSTTRKCDGLIKKTKNEKRVSKKMSFKRCIF